MKLNIPDIGIELVLTQDWSFKLFIEHRNFDLFKHADVNLTALKQDYWTLNYPRRTDDPEVWKRLENLYANFKGNFKLIKLPEGKKDVKKNWQVAEEITVPFNQFYTTYQQFLTKLEINRAHFEHSVYYDFTLPKGTILKIDRIYIRKGNSDYSSLTFWAKLPNQPKKARFWAHLSDVNNMHVEEWSLS